MTTNQLQPSACVVLLLMQPAWLSSLCSRLTPRQQANSQFSGLSEILNLHGYFSQMKISIYLIIMNTQSKIQSFALRNSLHQNQSIKFNASPNVFWVETCKIKPLILYCVCFALSKKMWGENWWEKRLWCKIYRSPFINNCSKVNMNIYNKTPKIHHIWRREAK